MGTIFVAGSYGAGKSTLCNAMSKVLTIPTYSAGDLISNINGEKYGENKTVKNKEKNQEILSLEVKKKLEQYPTILLAGHFCIFNKLNCVEMLPDSIYEKISIEQILLLEADPMRILTNLSIRDKKKYELSLIQLLLRKERQAAEEISQRCGCRLYVHKMLFDGSDLQTCCELLNTEEKAV